MKERSWRPNNRRVDDATIPGLVTGLHWGNSVIDIYQNNHNDLLSITSLLANKLMVFPFITPTKLIISLNDKESSFYTTIEHYMEKHNYPTNFIRNNFFWNN